MAIKFIINFAICCDRALLNNYSDPILIRKNRISSVERFKHTYKRTMNENNMLVLTQGTLRSSLSLTKTMNIRVMCDMGNFIKNVILSRIFDMKLTPNEFTSNKHLHTFVCTIVYLLNDDI